MGGQRSPPVKFCDRRKNHSVSLNKAEFDKVEGRPPASTFDHDLTLYLGDLEVRVIALGPAQTTGNAGVYLPKEKILFSGDIAFFYVSPLAHEGTLKGWVAAGDRIFQMDVETIVPGHGPIGTKADLKWVREYLLQIQEEGGKILDAGHGSLEAGKRVDLGPSGNGGSGRGSWSMSTDGTWSGKISWMLPWISAFTRSSLTNWRR